MRRRTFVAGLSALAALGTARAQGAPTIRIGWICYTAPGIALEAFQEGMRALGHSGRNAVGIELRVVANNPERVKAAVDELIGAGVVLIMAQAAVGPAVHRVAAGRIPLVFAFSGDPVVAGMAESFARPGGNTTGMSFMALELVGKRLEVMKEIVPSVRRVAILTNPQHPGEKAELAASLDAAGRMGVKTVYVTILPGEKPDAAFDRIRHEGVDGIIVFQDAGMVSRAGLIAEFALKERLPAVSGWAQFAEAGFLATYGPNLQDVYRRLASYVDRIFKGARADSLPVELPTRLELVVNLKTAKALGVVVPESVRRRADEVIQ